MRIVSRKRCASVVALALALPGILSLTAAAQLAGHDHDHHSHRLVAELLVHGHEHESGTPDHEHDWSSAQRPGVAVMRSEAVQAVATASLPSSASLQVADWRSWVFCTPHLFGLSPPDLSLIALRI